MFLPTHHIVPKRHFSPKEDLVTTIHHFYLGTDSDPKPVFRDEAPTAFEWPEGSVMAVYFAAEDFPGVARNEPHRVNRAEFFDDAGWPIELAPHLKASLPMETKREFQVFPQRWRDWSEDRWRIAHENPTWFARLRAQVGLARQLVRVLPRP